MGDGSTEIYTRSQRAQDPDRSYAHASCRIRGHSLHDEVVGFCEYGVGVETTKEHEGIYQISYIATALKVRGQHLGDTLLTSVIMRLRDDAWRSNRTPLVLTQVDPRNKPSMDLFSRFGFVDEGPDPNDPEYHLLSLEFAPQDRGNFFGSTIAFF